MKKGLNAPKAGCWCLLFFTSLFTGLSCAGTPGGKPAITLAASEREPYLGRALPGNGPVYEIVAEAMRRAGYELKVEFYPSLRARKLAARGVVDGVMPLYDSPEFAEDFLFSIPFLGDQVGLLKKRDLDVFFPVDPRTDLKEALAGLGEYRFGVQSGASELGVIQRAVGRSIQSVTEQLQNLDKLDHGRVDLVAIDKYIAADLMTDHRPHLIGQLEFMSPYLLNREFHVAFTRSNADALSHKAAIDAALASMAEDGTLQSIQDKHGLYASKPRSEEKKTLVIGVVDNPDMITMRRLSSEFEKANPDIQLEWRLLAENTLRRRLLSDLAIADGQFDVMTIGAYEAPIWAKRQWLHPIENLPESYQLDDVLQSVRSMLSHDEQLYALPFYAESSMTYYRTDLFAAAGLSMPPQPTYEDIRRFAERLHKPEESQYGICLRGKAGWGQNMALLGTMVNTFGGRWFDMQWRAQLDSDAWRQAVTFYTGLITDFGTPNPTDNGFKANLALFSEGHCAMWIDATVAAGLLFNPEQSRVHDRLGFSAAPIAETTRGANWLWTWALAIPESSEYKQAAQTFIEWATSQDYIVMVAEEQGWVSVPPGTRRSTYQNPHYRNAAPFADTVLAAIEGASPNNSTLQPVPYTGVQFVGIPEFNAIGNYVGRVVADIVRGDKSVDAGLKDAQQWTLKRMEDSGYVQTQ